MKKLFAGLLATMLALLPLLALAAPASEITRQCDLRASHNGDRIKCLLDRNYASSWRATCSRFSWLEISAPEGQSVGGLYVQWFNEAPPWRVDAWQDGAWQTVFECGDEFLAQYAALPANVRRCRIYPKEGKQSDLKMVELTVFGAGEPPAEVQRWQPVAEKCDLLVIAAHPDDEVLFMGGTLPYYGGALGKTVELLNLVPASAQRKLELLDCVWHCGVRNYPVFGRMRDKYATSLKEIYSRWSKQELYDFVLKTIRRCKPDVIVTHDINGEYGHGAHRAAADAAMRCIDMAANPHVHGKSLKQYGAWQVKKLYLHLYPQNALVMDWRAPLDAFGGKTAFDVATEAFAYHVSQQETRYRVEDSGPYDNRLFGLYFSTVGDDVRKDDFLEHIGAV